MTHWLLVDDIFKGLLLKCQQVYDLLLSVTQKQIGLDLNANSYQIAMKCTRFVLYCVVLWLDSNWFFPYWWDQFADNFS